MPKQIIYRTCAKLVQSMNNLLSGFGLIDEKMYHSYLEKNVFVFANNNQAKNKPQLIFFSRLSDFIIR